MTEFQVGDHVEGYVVDGSGPYRGYVLPKTEHTYDTETVVRPEGHPEGEFPEGLFFRTSTLTLIEKQVGTRDVLVQWPRAEILDEAKQLITGDRNLSYGTPTQNFKNTADLWNVQLGHKLKDGEEFTATDVAILMTHLKLARLIASGEKRDNYADAIGYLACAWETVVSDE